ncbi:MAG: hypothetical protein LCH44_13975 [Bacteroidetes bacterium]|nr:hypothetical protein [Bacteroidota bacterium]
MTQGSLFAEFEQTTPDFNYLPRESADEVARAVHHGCRILGLTRGQFSLIDLIYSILYTTGPSDVTCVTWSAGIKDARTVEWMVNTDKIKNFCLITDHSYVNRQKKYAIALSDLFGPGNIRTSEIHAKFCLISNEDWKITIRTSMNLNANRTCESFEIDENQSIYDFYNSFVMETFKNMPAGFTADSSTVNRALSTSFNNLNSNFYQW